MPPRYHCTPCLRTPPVLQVVPRLLSALLSLLDRLAAMQLAMTPPTITGRFTGVYHLNYAVPLSAGQAQLIELSSLLSAAVSATLLVPSRQHVHMVNLLVSGVWGGLGFSSCSSLRNGGVHVPSHACT